jgi:hypothetical protein
VYLIVTGGKCPELEAVTHLYLTPIFRISGAVSPIAHTSSWRGAYRNTLIFLNIMITLYAYEYTTKYVIVIEIKRHCTLKLKKYIAV